MKKILLFVCSAFLLGFSSCSSDDDNDDGGENITLEEAHKREMIEKYDVSINGLEIRGVSENEKEIIFYGELDNKLWVTCYNKTTEKILAQWHDSENIKEEIEIDLGYGNIKTARVTEYLIRSEKWTITNDSFVFQLIWVVGSDPVYDVYFTTNNKSNKKISNTGRSFYAWYNGSILIALDNIYETEKVCYDSYGNKIYDLGGSFPYTPEETVNHKEYINFTKDRIYKFNLETDKEVWDIESPLKDIPSEAKLDSKSIIKSNNLWTYTFNYTLYNGSKLARIIELNIETGEHNTLK